VPLARQTGGKDPPVETPNPLSPRSNILRHVSRVPLARQTGGKDPLVERASFAKGDSSLQLVCSRRGLTRFALSVCDHSIIRLEYSFFSFFVNRSLLQSFGLRPATEDARPPSRREGSPGRKGELRKGGFFATVDSLGARISPHNL
jgi:hypothetical protein